MAKTRTITRVVRVKSKRRAHRKFTVPLAMVAGFAPLAVTGIAAYQKAGAKYALQELTWALTGWDIPGKRFDAGGLMRGTVPIVLGVLLHKIVGGKLGVNKMLAQANVPLLRI